MNHPSRHARPAPASRASWLADRADAWTLLVLLGLALLFALPLFAHPGKMRNPDNGDCLNYYLHLELVRRSVIGYGQFPFWSPYVRGGIPLVGHPRDVSLSPVVLFALLFQPITAVKAICLFIYLAAALGMYYLVRVALGVGRIGAAAAGVLFIGSEWLPARLVSGNFDEWHLVLFPLLAAFYLRSREDRRFLIYGALVVYVTVMDGKYVVAIFGLYLALWGLADAVRGLLCGEGLRAAGSLLRLAGMFGLGALLAAGKILPLVQMLASGQARSDFTLQAGWTLGLERFGLRDFNWRSSNFQTQIWDIGTWYLALLFFLAACAVRSRRMLGWLVLVLLSVLLMHGGHSALPRWLDPFRLLHRLPVFSAMAKPFKYFNVFVLMGVCVGTGHFLDRLAAWKGRWRGALLAAVLAVPAVGVPFAWHIRLNWHLFDYPVKGPPVMKLPEFYQLEAFDPREKKQRFRMFLDYFFVREGVGILNWYDPMELPCHAVARYRLRLILGDKFNEYRYRKNPAWRGEVFLAGGAGRAGIRPGTWSPLGFTVDLAGVKEGALLVVNQNYDRRWHSSAGEVVRASDGRLAVRLPAGAAEVRLRYRPVDHYLALAVSVLAFVGCGAALLIARRRRMRNPSST